MPPSTSNRYKVSKSDNFRLSDLDDPFGPIRVHVSSPPLDPKDMVSNSTVNTIVTWRCPYYRTNTTHLFMYATILFTPRKWWVIPRWTPIVTWHILTDSSKLTCSRTQQALSPWFQRGKSFHDEFWLLYDTVSLQNDRNSHSGAADRPIHIYDSSPDLKHDSKRYRRQPAPAIRNPSKRRYISENDVDWIKSELREIKTYIEEIGEHLRRDVDLKLELLEYRIKEVSEELYKA